MFKKIRILILLAILGFVAVNTWLDKTWSTDWDEPLWVAVFPINADQSDASARLIAKLQDEDFDLINRYMAREANRHGRTIGQSFEFNIVNASATLPPQRPTSRNPIITGWWSLKLRYWARQQTKQADIPTPDVRLFLLYFDPATSPTVAHSLGLQKGLIGVVHLFAHSSQTPQNQIVVTHELLHTLGATDKYDFASNQPRFPDGFVQPQKVPLYPQLLAELMAGRVPISENQSKMPSSLGQTQIGKLTALEIGWIQ